MLLLLLSLLLLREGERKACPYSTSRATTRPSSSGRGEVQQGLSFLFLQHGKKRTVLVVHLIQERQLAPLLALLLLLLL